MTRIPVGRRIRVWDLDGSVTAQAGLLDRYRQRAEVVDLRAWGPRVRYLSGLARLREVTAAAGPWEEGDLTLLGSGDFHHLTAGILDQVGRAFCLVLFDNHPDWDRRLPMNCGAWLNRAIDHPLVERIVMIGMSTKDLAWRNLIWGRASALRSGRAEIYPIGRRPPLGGRGGLRARWMPLDELGWTRFNSRLSHRLRGSTVYISIDKDCLEPAAAVTNWEPGRMPLPRLIEALGTLRRHCEVIGADIVGEYSPVVLDHPIKRLISALDRPPAPRRVPPGSLALNERTNLALIEAIVAPAGPNDGRDLRGDPEPGQEGSGEAIHAPAAERVRLPDGREAGRG